MSISDRDSLSEAYQFSSPKIIVALLAKQGNIFITSILSEEKLSSYIFNFHLFKFAISQNRESIS